MNRRGFLGGLLALVAAPAVGRLDRQAWKVRQHAYNYGFLREDGLRKVMTDNYAVGVRIPREMWEDDAYSAIREMVPKLADAVKKGGMHGGW